LNQEIKMQFKFTKFASVLIASGIISLPLAAHANDSSELEELRGLVQELSQQVKVLARKGEINEEDAVAAKKSTPVVKASENGFGFESADGKNVIKLRGLLQIDNRNYSNVNGLGADGKNISGFDFRRIRPTVEGTVFGKYDFRFTPEFGEAKTSNATSTSGIVDAYVDARFQPWFKLRAGKFKPFVGLERLQSGSDIKFIERSYVSNNILPNRDLGAAIHGDVLNDKLNYSVGIYNGVTDGADNSTSQDTNVDKDYAFRVFATPFKDDVSVLSGLGFGLAATYGNFKGTSAASSLPAYKTAGQESSFFTYSSGVFGNGKRERIAPQAYYYYGPFGVIAEYARVSQDVTNGTTKAKLDNDAWQIAASYLITGEDASFKGVKPNQVFDTDKGGWGAWELVARYQENNIDKGAFSSGTSAGVVTTTRYADPRINAQSAKSWALGVNWYLNQNVKIAVDYENTSFDGGGNATAAATPLGTGSLINIADRPDEKSLFTRLQISY
jgi:phosphate-selective porin OprO/OprP